MSERLRQPASRAADDRRPNAGSGGRSITTRPRPSRLPRAPWSGSASHRGLWLVPLHGDHPYHVVGFVGEEEIDIAGQSGVPVKDDRLPPDDQIPSLVLREERDEGTTVRREVSGVYPDRWRARTSLASAGYARALSSRAASRRCNWDVAPVRDHFEREDAAGRAGGRPAG